jgi:hypothetical protein
MRDDVVNCVGCCRASLCSTEHTQWILYQVKLSHLLPCVVIELWRAALTHMTAYRDTVTPYKGVSRLSRLGRKQGIVECHALSRLSRYPDLVFVSGYNLMLF